MITVHQGKFTGRINRDVAPEEIGTWDEVMKNAQLPPDFNFDKVGCKNKFVIQTDAEKVLENMTGYWYKCGFHRTLYLGDYRKQPKNLATLTGMTFIQEDRG